MFLDTFPTWLKSLGDDVQAVASTLRDAELPEGARRFAAGSVNYLFKSLDLIPDGIEDIGFLDDAFVLRVSAAQAVAAGVGDGAGAATLKRLASEADAVRAFLGDDYRRLEAYTKSLSKGAARGRTVDDILGDAAVRDALISEVAGWAEAYQAPTFTRDEKTLVKLKGFLESKLPKLPVAARPEPQLQPPLRDAEQRGGAPEIAAARAHGRVDLLVGEISWLAHLLLSQPAVERRARHAERARGALRHVVVVGERAQQRGPIRAGASDRGRGGARGRSGVRIPEGLAEERVGRHGGREPRHLAHVASPRAREQTEHPLERDGRGVSVCRSHQPRRARLALHARREEVREERRDVRKAGRERRQRELEPREPRPQIRAKPPGGDLVAQLAVRRAHDARVRRHLVRRADRPHRADLERAQELRLHRR